jgi:A/G-specific adenine glycosylase
MSLKLFLDKLKIGYNNGAITAPFPFYYMNTEYKKFTKIVWDFYSAQGRHDLPWRQTHDPYAILVSEVMLQQTQVERVIPKYTAFLQRFPKVEMLAIAPLGEVLTLWQGLGYNRRAKSLQACAQEVVMHYNGVFPQTEVALRALPGIGPYTASAVLAFAFNIPSPLIETNVRTVYIHHFFPDATDVSDALLLPHITATLDSEKPRDWYYALMDYGSYLKREHGNNGSRSKHYTVQSKFKGSDRQVRGAILRALVNERGSLSEASLQKKLRTEGITNDLQFDAQLAKLAKEGLIEQKKPHHYQLPR